MMIKKIEKKASLFVGRWQPFHNGHKKLIETVLKKGKSVVVAIRATEISKENPYTVIERWTMIQKALKKYAEFVNIVVIPDIDEICYGRHVGYDIRRIYLDGDIEAVSATKIRKRTLRYYPIIWLTGQTGSGKTTLAHALQKEIGGVILDGDEMRKSISLGAGFSREDRHSHNLRVARLAKVLARKNPVIVAVIAPFEKTRLQITKMIEPVWVYVKRKLPKEKNRPYQVPKKPNVVLDTNKQKVKEEVEAILNFLKKARKRE